MINEKLKFPDKPTKLMLHQFPNERIKPLYDDIVSAIIVPAGCDMIDISDALIALAAVVISTLEMAPEQYRQSLRAQIVLRIGSGQGIRMETDPTKIAEQLLKR
jgi:hypothetical protein